jgi:hypothetical protein
VQLSICCSSRGSATAARLAARLERNLEIQTLLIEEDSVPVYETWEEGTAAGAILILLDGLSAPAPLRRESWSALIDHDAEPPVAFACLEPAAYPKLLERRPFFPAADPLTLDRAVERWLAAQLPSFPGIEINHHPAPFPDDWWPSLVDSPGQTTTADPAAAHAFAHHAAPHFQSVLWIGAARRDPALIRAELDHRLPAGRTLVVLAHLDKPLKNLPARHSYLQILGAPPVQDLSPALAACYAPCFPAWFATELGADLSQAVPLQQSVWYRTAHTGPSNDELRLRHLQLLHRYFQGWKSNPEPCRTLLAELPAALDFAFPRHWTQAVELCRRAAFLLKADGRRREAIRLFHRLLLEAEEQMDRDTADDARHELSWLTGEDTPQRRPSEPAGQLSLDLFA